MSDSAPWPPSTGLTTKIVPRTSAILTLCYATTVHAPAPLVFNAILNVSEYPKWNTWVPSVHIDSSPSPSDCMLRNGTSMTFTVIMDASKPHSITTTSLLVCDISTPTSPSSYLPPHLLDDPTFTADLGKVYRVSWTGNGGPMSYLMKLERFHEVVVTGENECEVRTWEVMGGILAKVVKGFYGKVLLEKVGVWCRDLKGWCEEMHRREGGGGE